LKGVEEKLGYFHDLGITTVLLTPLYESPFYHSYFARDFEKIDPAYGTEKDLRHLAQALHQRGMKIFVDEEIQYVTSDHIWYRDSLNRPNSKFSHYLLYNGPANTQPEPGPWGIADLPTYEGRTYRIATLNLYDPAVLEYQTKHLQYWMNPTGPGHRDDGVDGFRIDHMQDDLDAKGKLTDLFGRFWTPMFRQLKAENPRVRIVAEQADWGYGDDWLTRGHVDMVFAFPLRSAIVSFDKKRITEAITDTWRKTPAGRQQLIFIENHDMNRFASEVGGDVRKEKVGAALNVLLKGIPLIYYGQELGMEGKQFQAWKSDANDIPVREAFPWTATVTRGVAVWYKDTGPWWTQSALANGRGPSLESETNSPDSVYSYYKRLLALRKTHPELVTGDQSVVKNDSDSVFSFVRFEGDRRTVVAINLSEKPVTAQLAASEATPDSRAVLHNPMTDKAVTRSADGDFAVTLADYGVGIYEVSEAKGAR